MFLKHQYPLHEYYGVIQSDFVYFNVYVSILKSDLNLMIVIKLDSDISKERLMFMYSCIFTIDYLL